MSARVSVEVKRSATTGLTAASAAYLDEEPGM